MNQISQLTLKRAESAEIERQTEEYLARGGAIESVSQEHTGWLTATGRIQGGLEKASRTISGAKAARKRAREQGFKRMESAKQ